MQYKPKVEAAMADNDLQNQLNDLKADLKNLQTDVGELVEILKALGLQKADGIKSSVKDDLQSKREELRRRWDRVRDRERKTVDDLEEGIGQHPLSSVFTAFFVGIIISRLLDLGGRR